MRVETVDLSWVGGGGRGMLEKGVRWSAKTK